MIERNGYRLQLKIRSGTILLYASFALSCINSTVLMVWLILMPVYMVVRYGREGAVESFILVQLRSILSSGVGAVVTGPASYVKWAVVFLLSFYLLQDIKSVEDVEFKRTTWRIVIFSAFAMLAAWMTSSYPTTASFKVLSYAVPFIAIMVGVFKTPEIDWIRRLTAPLGLLCLGSAVLIGSSVGYLRNGTSFQGLFIHPNLYGVVLGLFLAGYLHSVNKLSIKSIAVIASVLSLAALTQSRTGLLTAVAVVLIFLLSLDTRAMARIFLAVLLIFLVALLVLLDTPVTDAFLSFMQKGHAGDFFYSRSEQWADSFDRFLSSPILGTGFNVPFSRYTRSYTLSFDLITENGNLILALLGDVGVVGFILFLFAYIKLFRVGRGARTLIFFAPFLVSMGEMTFFSTNNIAIIMYLYFGIYVRDGWLSRQPLSEHTTLEK